MTRGNRATQQKKPQPKSAGSAVTRRIKPKADASSLETVPAARELPRSHLTSDTAGSALTRPGLQKAQRQAMALQIGNLHGNQHLQRAVAELTTTEKHHQNTTARTRSRTDPGSSVQMRRKRKPAKSALASVGGAGTHTFVEDPASAEPIAAGERGFTRSLLPEIEGTAALALDAFKDYRLTAVEPSLSGIDKLISEALSYQTKYERKAKKEKESWFGYRFWERHWAKQAKGWEARGEKLMAQKSETEGKFGTYNAWVPRANQMLGSLSRLAILSNSLGISDQEAMVAAVVESLKEATKVGEVAQRRGFYGGLSVPEADSQVSSAAVEQNLAAEEMRNKWLGYKQALLRGRAKTLAGMWSKEETKLKDIMEVIDTWAKIGKTVDVAIAVIGGAKKMAVAETTGEGAKEIGKGVAEGVGIPTSVEGLFRGGVKILYQEEIDKIETTLKLLSNAISAHNKEAERLHVKEQLASFETAFKRYKKASSDLAKSLVARQAAYLKLGEQLDVAAAGRKAGKGKGKERFATVMLVTSAVREVLAMANGAKAGFDSPKQFWDWYTKVAPEADRASVRNVFHQLRMFTTVVGNLNRVYGPVEREAGTMMKKLTAGEPEEAAAY